MDRDRVKGAVDSTRGKLKESAGRVLSDEKLKREGQTDKVKGKVQNTVGGMKDSMRDRNKH